MNNFKELQNTHQKLLYQYVDLLNRVSELPFFIDIFSMRKTIKAKIERFNFLLYIYNGLLIPFQFLLRFLMWKPLVRLFVEAHIHSRLRDISKSYIQLIQTIDFSKKNNQKEIEWISKAIENCKKFESTLFSWLSLKGSFIWLLNITIGLVLAWVGFDNIFQLVTKFEWSKNITSLFLMLATILFISITYGLLIFVVISFSFQAKRIMLFANIDLRRISKDQLLPTENIYETENHLFSIIGCKKMPEFPIDIFSTFLITCFIPILIYFFIVFYIFDKTPNMNSGAAIALFLFFALIPIINGLQHLIEWNNREWR